MTLESRRAVDLTLHAALFLMVALSAACGGYIPAPEHKAPRGACAVRYDLMGKEPDGPYFCMEDFSKASCDDDHDEFYEGQTCDSAGFGFCCKTELDNYQFRSASDARWYDELGDPNHSYPNCADHQVACATASSSSSNGTGSGAQEPECTSDVSCPSHTACSSGKCVTVECTSDSHCGSCSRCSGNVCRSCGSGPYGCYC